jgi:hypothetical protein
VDRVAWDDLPKEVTDAITARTGQIAAIRTPGAGLKALSEITVPGRAWLIDWAWPTPAASTRGQSRSPKPAWTNAAGG